MQKINIDQVKKLDNSIANLFDIKTISEPTAQKGWSCISNAQPKRLAKADVPTVYDKLLEKLLGVDVSVSDSPVTINSGVAAAHGYDCDETYLYATTAWGDGNGWLVKRTLLSNLPLTNWESLNIYVGGDSSGNSLCVGDNLIVAYNSNTSKICVHKKSDNSLYKELTITNGSNTANITKAIVNNTKVFFIAYKDINSQYCLAKIEDNITSDIQTLITDLDGLSGNPVYISGGTFIFCCNGKIYKTEDNFQTYTQISTTVSGSADKPCSLYKIENKIVASGKDGYSSGYKISYDNGDTWNDGTSFVNISGVCPNGWCDGNELYVFVHVLSWYECFLYHTSDFVNWERIGDIHPSISTPRIVFDKQNKDIFYQLDNRNFLYLGIIKTIYTDTINGIDIKYYKNGNWKICTPNIAVGNDTNLQSVYEYLGYLNYWWIDTTNEQITLQRNSNMWTFMYVGDDYIDSSLPNGNYYAYATKNDIPNVNIYKEKAQTIEIDTASVTIDNVLANKNYVLSNNAITDITLTACETSMEETTIQFTTGSSAPTLTDNSGLVWFDGIPTLQANTTYVIVIFNKQAFYQEN